MSNNTLRMRQEMGQETLSRALSSIEIGFSRSETFKYAIYGAMFGFLFPIIATLLESVLNAQQLTWAVIVEVQRSNPLLWIIDSAPFWLGLFASIAGRRQDHLKRVIRKLVSEVPETRHVLNEEEATAGEASSFALLLTVCGGGLVIFVLLLIIVWLQTLIHTI